MLTLILRYAYLFIPLIGGALAVGSCHRFGLAKRLARPIDARRTFRGRRLFGDNKTWRGILAMALGTAPVFGLQATWLHQHEVWRELEFFDYGAIPAPWAIGFALGAAAMLAELPNSFSKRQLGIAPGQAGQRALGVLFHFIDQVDLLLGYWLVLSAVAPLDWGIVLGSIPFLFLSHQLVTLIGYFLKMRKTAR